MNNLNAKQSLLSIFEQLGVKIVNGYRFLSGFIGDHDSTKAFVQKKIMEWANSIVKLSNVAESQPQAPCICCFSKICTIWVVIPATQLPNFDEEYFIIQEALNGKFWPAGTISPQEQL